MAALSPAVALAIADGEASDRPSRALVTYRLQVLVVTFTTFHDLGLRYTFLKSHRLANCTFTFDQMVGEEGNTFVFLLNTQAKIRRITDNSRKDIDELKKDGGNVKNVKNMRWNRLHLRKDYPHEMGPSV